MSVFFSLEAKGPVLHYEERSHCHRCFLSHSSAPGKPETPLWENASLSHLAPLVSTHVVIWQDEEISVGRRFCLPCTLPSSQQVCACHSIPVCLTCCW